MDFNECSRASFFVTILLRYVPISADDQVTALLIQCLDVDVGLLQRNETMLLRRHIVIHSVLLARE